MFGLNCVGFCNETVRVSRMPLYSAGLQGQKGLSSQQSIASRDESRLDANLAARKSILKPRESSGDKGSSNTWWQSFHSSFWLQRWKKRFPTCVHLPLQCQCDDYKGAMCGADCMHCSSSFSFKRLCRGNFLCIKTSLKFPPGMNCNDSLFLQV